MSRPHLILALMLLSLATTVATAWGQEAEGQAAALFNRGEFREAAAAFQRIIDHQATPEAYAGLLQSLLKLDDVDAAEEQSHKALEGFPQSAAALAADGDVKFRRGMFAEAEEQYAAALKHDEKCARAWLGMARIESAKAKPREAREDLSKAHDLGPQDGDIVYYWALNQPYPKNVAELEKHLASFGNDADWERREREYVDLIKALAGRKVWIPAREVKQAVLKLEAIISSQPMAPQNRDRTAAQPIMANPEDRLRGYSLEVKLNDRAKARVLVDTGSSGLTISQKLAEKAGAKKLSEHSLEGVGNAGPVKGYEAWVDKVTIGEFEFHDCHVRVSPRGSGDFDGLIGTNVFADYLITLDLAAHKLRLEPLPPPAEAAQDSFTPFYAFGHIVLMPTTVGKSAHALFLLDTGASTNSISPQMARRVGRVRDSNLTVKGMSGEVKNVYTVDDAALDFAHVHQSHQDLITFDVRAISKQLGTEISGMIGFATLKNMKVVIDYRDGVVEVKEAGSH
ncbi:MAG TPA: aspartyl protease family protein [Terriglobales bacterium]|nr:aspartyl protease family protein [Terriglobales bacterium]